jgi:magnesium-transporting ATPase (P-type)
VLLLLCFFLLWSHSTRAQRLFLAAMMAFAACYIVFMVTIDVPMYWARWQVQLAASTQHLSLWSGLIDASRSCVVSFEYVIWRQEIPWMTLYFTGAVWVSILLPHAPGWRNTPHRLEAVESDRSEQSSTVV